ncbi:MAG: DUF2461 domain-containing protein [Sandaracinaceae bacterium]
MAEFEGFPKVTFSFLKGLARNNDKAWFEAHRADYEAGYVEPAKAFVSAIGPRLKKVSKTISYDPRINGSIFRINRDVRFSKDKSPYKPHLDLWFWEGERRGWDSPGFFFRMFHDRLILGAGMHGFEKDLLARYRDAALDEKAGKALIKVMKDVEKTSLTMGAPERKKIPRGFDAEHPRAEQLLRESLFAHQETKLPKEASSARLVDYCVDRFKAGRGINAWLLANVSH